MTASRLKEIRTQLGFTTARSFFQDHLSKKAQLDFNYSYYMKIEGGRALPSAGVISTIARTLSPEQQKLLITAYCQSLFPDQAAFFRSPSKISKSANRNFALAKPTTPQPTLIKQRFLNEAQIAALTKSREHYSIFLILTLAREPVSLRELATKAPSASLNAVLADLKVAQLTSVEDGHADCIVKEMKFPKADTKNLEAMYRDIDQWSAAFAKSMGFEETLEKMMIRRVSGRYLGLLTMQAQLLFDSLKAFDEIDAVHNDDVILLNFTLARGQLPG